MRNLLLFLLVLSGISASAQTTWLRSEYLECLENSLPCDCQSKRLSIQADTITSAAMIGYDDPGYADLRRMAPAEYGVLNLLHREGKEDTIVIYSTLRFKGDTIFYYDGFSDLIMIKQSETSPTYIDYLNAALIKRNYPPLEKTLGEDSLKCYCNTDADITTIHAQNRHWSIERGQKDLNTVYLYELLNFPEGKVVYFAQQPNGKIKWLYKLKKKLVAKYKWA